MTKHSPGPWKIVVADGSRLAIRPNRALGYLCTLSDYPLCEQRADAKLIAAAPEMLEALKNLCGNETSFAKRKQFFEDALKVIAKAEDQE